MCRTQHYITMIKHVPLKTNRIDSCHFVFVGIAASSDNTLLFIKWFAHLAHHDAKIDEISAITTTRNNAMTAIEKNSVVLSFIYFSFFSKKNGDARN
jgi:hypothetical protein